MNRQTIVDLVIVLAIAAVPMSMYGNNLIMDINVTFQVNPHLELQRQMEAWTESGFGYPTGLDRGFAFPVTFFYAALHAIGIPSSLTVKIWVTSLLFVSGASIYALSAVVFERLTRVARIFSAFAYMSSPYVLLSLTGSSIPLLSYAAFPLILTLFIKGMQSSRPYRPAIALALLSQVVSFPQPAINLAIIICLAVLLLYLVITHRTSGSKHALILVTSASLFTLGLSSWYLYPNLVGLFGQANQAISTFQYYEGTRFFSLYSEMPSVLRLISSPGIYSSTSPYGNYFLTNSYVIFGGFLVVYLFVTGLLVSTDQKWRFFRFYFGLVFLVALFMAGGTSTPGVGYVFGWLYIHVPGFWVFQNGYNWLFVIALAYAISLTALLDTMSNRMGRRMRFVLRPIAIILMILIILSSSLPLYQGRIFESGGVFPQIPSYWQNAAQWINSQPGDFKIFLLPGGGPFPTYSWGHPRDAVTSAIVSKPTIFWSAEISPSIVSLYTAIYNTVQLRSPNTFPEALSAIGARYVIVQGDVDNYGDINSINKWLRNLPGLLNVGTFGPLEIYENMLYNGRIFVAGNQHLLFSGTSLVAISSPSGRVDFSSNTANFRNSLPNETDTKSWSLVAGNAVISTGEGPFANTQSISVSGVSDTSGFLAVKYNFPVSLTGTKHLMIWLKSASFISSNGFQLRFLDSGARVEIFDYPFDIPADSWVQWVIDVQSPDHVDTGFQASESLDLVPFFGVAFGRAMSFEFGGIDLNPILGPSKNASLSYYESSPTSYTVHANATGAYVLVFSDSYSPQWTAYIDGEQVTNHFEINNYSNAWLINKTGSYDITINFTGQQSYFYGEVLTGFTFVLMLLYLVSTEPASVHFLRRVAKIIKAKRRRAPTDLKGEKKTSLWEGEQIAPDTSFFDLPGDHVVRYLFAKQFVYNKVVLDDCCGAGYGSTFLAENGSKFVIGLDVSEAATTFARNQYKYGNLDFTRQDATRLAFADKGFDVIVSFEAVEHIREYRKYLGEIVRCLKNDGIYVMSTPNKLMTSPIWKTPYNHWHVQEFRPVELKHLLEDFFSEVELLGEHSYNAKWNRMESRYKIANFVHPILLRWLPRRMKDLYLGISLAKERVKSTDWAIDKLNINHSYCIVAICRSPKGREPRVL